MIPDWSARDRAVLAVGIIAAATLSFTNLDAQFLWQDEAQSALLARTTLASGIPLGTDGRNFFSQELGAEYDDAYRWRWHTWLHLYLVAGSFAVFGESTQAARWPAALFGVLTLIALYRLAREWWRGRAVAEGSVVALLLLVPFWILSRQCRYYSLTAFFSLLLLLGYARIWHGRRWGAALYAGSAFALFHAHYVYLPPLLAATVLHAALHRREQLARVGWAAAAGLLLCAPWIVWQSGMDYGRNYAGQLSDPGLWLANLGWFTRKLLVNASGLVALLAALLIAGWLWATAGRREVARLARDPGLQLLALAAAFVLATVSIVAPTGFFRYVTPLLPLLALASGGLLAVAARIHTAVAVALVAGLALTQPIARFGYELTHDFTGPIEGLVTYLHDNAAEDDVVWITYGDLPLKFYTNLRVLGGLTGEDLERAAVLEPPDWVIPRSRVIHPERDGRVADFIKRQIDLTEFRKIELPFTDTPFENREEPAEHRFRSARGGAPVVLFERAD